KAHQPEPRIVDDKLRLGAPSGQSLAYQVRHAGNEKIGCNDDRTASPRRGNFIGQRIQPLFSSRNQCQLVAMSREDPRQRQADPVEAPVMIVIGRGFVIALQSRARNHHAMTDHPRASALFEKFAWREVARKYRLLDELLRIEGPELADLRI